MKRLWHLCLGLLVGVVLAASSVKADPVVEFLGDVERLLIHGEYDKLDSMAAEFRKTDARFFGGNSKLYHLYFALGAVKAPPGCPCARNTSDFTFEEKERALKEWLAQRPQSLTARLALGRLFITYAWHARGGGYANEVKDEQWKLFGDRLQTASEFLKGLDPNDDPVVYTEYGALAENLFSSREAMDKIYAAATRDYPRFFHTYADRANVLQEKWFGRPGELARYTQSLLSSPGGEDGQIAYTYVAARLSEQYKREEIFEKTGLIWPLLKDAYLTRDRVYGLHSGDLNLSLKYAIAANDIAFAAELIPRIGDDWAKSVWGTKSTFDATVAWVRANHH